VLTGTIRASDPDGIDSVWITMGSIEQGADGFFERDFQAPFQMPVGEGLLENASVEVRLRGRDLAGFSATVVDTVTVIP
jgi:hypothetical protein